MFCKIVRLNVKGVFRQPFLEDISNRHYMLAVLDMIEQLSRGQDFRVSFRGSGALLWLGADVLLKNDASLSFFVTSE